MNNVEMTPQQAAQEVIKLKKTYAEKNTPNSGFHATDEAKALSSQANFLRQEYGVDESKYGSNVSLADAYMHYYEDFGGQQTQQQTQPQDIQNFWQNASNSFYDSQKALFDKQLSEEITNLQIAYNQAINEGKLSINEAKEQFEEQKKALEQQAYQQFKATSLYGSEMGIQHSPQMVGLQQSDNARFNSFHNENAKVRDRRINEIRDRINQITMERDLKLTDAQAQHNYNLAGAKAQADQIYNQSMGQFMIDDYFTGRKEQHDYNMLDRQFDQTKELRYLDWGFKKEEMALADYYYTKNLKYASDLKINEMYVGHKLNLEEIDVMFNNTIKELHVKYGLDSKLQSQAHSNAIAEISARVKAEAKAADAEYEKAKQRQALSLGLPANATEKQIADKMEAKEWERWEKEVKYKRDAAIQDSIAMGITEYEINQILNNPDLQLNPKKPKDYTANSPLGKFDPGGNMLNFFTGYNKKNEKYKEEEAKKQAALDAINRLKSNTGIK